MTPEELDKQRQREQQSRKLYKDKEIIRVAAAFHAFLQEH